MYFRLRVVRLEDGSFALQISSDNLSWRIMATGKEATEVIEFAKHIDSEINNYTRNIKETHVLWSCQEPSKTRTYK